MAEFPLEKIKIGNDVYKIAAGGGPTVRTMHWEYTTYRYLATLVADNAWDSAKVGDVVIIDAMEEADQVDGDWLITNCLMRTSGNLDVEISGSSNVLLTFNDEVAQAWKTDDLSPSTHNNLISTRHDMVCIITGIYKDARDWCRFTLRPLNKYRANPFGIGEKLYVATEQWKTQNIADSVINACGLLNGSRFNSDENLLPGVTCKNANNQSVQPGGGKGKYDLGEGYYLEAFYFDSAAQVQAITHFDYTDSMNSSHSANVLGFYGCYDTGSRKKMAFYDTYFVKGDTQSKSGYWPTNASALASSTCLCIYVVYRH